MVKIETEIIKAIKAFVEMYMPKYVFTDSTYDGLQFCATHRVNNNNLLFIRIIIVENQIQITNIFLPPEYEHTGFGKKTLSIIRSIAEKHNYTVVLIDVVDGFKNRLIRRGAKAAGQKGEHIILTSQTNLN